MGEHTKISWCTSSWSPWIGCTEVSEGCTGCYARELDKRYRWGGATHWGAGVPRYRTSASTWKQPLAWNRKAAATGERWTVFPSLCDPFDNEVPEEWRADLWALIHKTPALTWLLLTKRIGNVAKMVPWSEHAWPNVWIGASIVNQEEADRDIPKLLSVPATTRFVSYEPALGPVDFDGDNYSDHGWLRGWHCEAERDGKGDAVPTQVQNTCLDWVICGGESSQGKHKARPFDIGWARSTIAQCKAAGVAAFCKQIGSNAGTMLRAGGGTWERFPTHDRSGADPAEWPEDLRVQELPPPITEAAECKLIDRMLEEGYYPVRELPDGTLAGVKRMMLTTGLFVGLHEHGYQRRYCYEHLRDAEQALHEWDGQGDPPGAWLKEKPSDRLGPGITGGG